MDYAKKILSKDKYISRKELTKLVNNLKLKGIILDNEKLLTMVKYHNDKFIIKKQKEYKNYFEHIFDEVDPNIKLDEEQIKTILIDQDYCLVVAGAGSGKTTTMSAKVKYLIEKQNVNPNNIIIMSFTKKATEELEDRINKQFKLGAKVTTFHKLGMEIIKKSYKKYIKVITEEQKQQILKDFIVENLFYDKKLLKKINDAFCNYLLFDRKVKKYKTFDDYYIYYIKKIYKQNKTNINEYNERIIKEKMLNHTTINNQEYNERTKILISNFLFKLNIPYYDKKSFPHKNEFMTIENKNNTSFFILNDELYYEEIKKISDYFKKNIREIFDNTKVYNKFEKKLIKSCSFKEKTEKEIFTELMNYKKEDLFSRFVSLSINFITRFKEKNYTINDIDTIYKKIKDTNLKKQLEYIKLVINYYNDYLKKNNLIDFEDMVNHAYDTMENYKKINKNVNYDYIIIDEYQDVSKQKYKFIKKLSDLYDAKILAVGDDWQSIFEFSGSEVSIFTNFFNMMGYGEILKITNTYRNSQELIDVAGNFILKNKNQIQKQLKSNKHIENPIEIHYYTDENINEKVDLIIEILKEIYIKNNKSKILLMGRYNDDINFLIESNKFIKTENNKIVLKKNKDIFITFLTAHASKGLGFDEVIIINALNCKKGFPSKKENDPIISIFDSKDKNNKINFPEERRLFYVALTRTKNKVYIISPKNNPSEFITEIRKEKSVIERFNTI